MTSNQIAKQQADAATYQAESAAKQARSSAKQARVASRKQKEDRRHNKEMEAIQGAAAGSKAATDTLIAGGKLAGMFANDVDWYTASKDLLESTCNRSFNASLGTRFASDIKMIPGQTIPGVMNIRWSPMLPASNSVNNAVNKAAYSLYAYIRYANSGSRNYTAADLMQYILCMDSIYALYAQCCKFYGISRMYSADNRYLPEGLGYTQEFLSSIRDNPALYRTRLNLCAKYINSWYVPTKLSLFQRHVFMSSQIFTDTDSKFAQLYNFVMTGAWQFNETSPEKAPIPAAGSLKYIHLIQNVSAIGWLSTLEDMIDALLKIEDIGIMSGDILKVYGADVYKVNPIEEDFTVPIVYHPEILTQIENMSIVGELASEPYIVQYEQVSGSTSEFALKWFNSMTISPKQDASKPVTAVGDNSGSYPFRTIYQQNVAADQYINLPDNKIKAGDVMVATRLKAIPQFVDAGNHSYLFNLQECGTEIVHSIEIVYDSSPESTTGKFNRRVIDCSVWGVDLTVQEPDRFTVYRYLCSFDWCPQVLGYVFAGDITPAPVNFAASQDLRRISKLSFEDLTNMNVVAFTKEIGLADADARADRAKRY